MYKMVLQDYRLHFKDSLKNLYNSGWYIYIYLIVMGPMVLDAGDSLEAGLKYYFAFIPFMIALMLSRMYSGLMGKTFYLCPLSKEQRKSYFLAGMKLRILFPISLFILLNSILLILKFDSILLFFAKLLVVSCAAVSFNIYCQPVIKSPNSMERSYPLLGNYELYNITSQFIAIFALFLFTEWESFVILGKVVTAVFVAVQLYVCIQLIRKFYPQIICQTEYFE